MHAEVEAAVGYTQGGLDGNVSSGGFDMYVVKYDGAGTRQWTKQLGTGSASGSIYSVAIDPSNAIYVAETTGGMEGNPGAGGYDLFVVKYDASGGRL